MPCLVVEVHAGSSDVYTDACLSFVKYRRYACSFASSWLNACMVALLIYSCMIFIVDASGHAMFRRSVYL